MKEPTKDELLDDVLRKLSVIEAQLNDVSNKYNDVLGKYKTAIEGLKVILEAGDCGGIAEKTLEEINNIT